VAPSLRIVACCLGALALSLVAVGVVSGTVVRHLVQMAPVLLAAAVVSSLPALGAAVSLPVYGTWLALMTGIWLYVLGIATLFRGTFTPFELFLTALIGACCLLGGGAGAARHAGVDCAPHRRLRCLRCAATRRVVAELPPRHFTRLAPPRGILRMPS